MSDDGGIAFGKTLAVTCDVSADQRTANPGSTRPSQSSRTGARRDAASRALRPSRGSSNAAVIGLMASTLSVMITQVTARRAVTGGEDGWGERAQPAARRPSANPTARGGMGRVQGSETTNGWPPSLAFRLDAAFSAASRVAYSPTLTL